jgi:hypothetical protein
MTADFHDILWWRDDSLKKYKSNDGEKLLCRNSKDNPFKCNYSAFKQAKGILLILQSPLVISSCKLFVENNQWDILEGKIINF